MPHVIITPAPASAAALPTANLFSQFDASDVANHNTGTGVWAPSAGSSVATIRAKASVGGSTTTFGYSATSQNGMPVIEAHGSKCFEYSTLDNVTDYPDGIVVLAAFRIVTGSSGNEVLRLRLGSGSSYARIYFPSAENVAFHVPSSATISNAVSAGIDDADNEFRIVAAGMKNSDSGFVLTSNPADYITAAGDSGDNVRFRGTETTLFNGMDFDICELLMYTKLSAGVAARAMEYLRNKWNPGG